RRVGGGELAAPRGGVRGVPLHHRRGEAPPADLEERALRRRRLGLGELRTLRRPGGPRGGSARRADARTRAPARPLRLAATAARKSPRAACRRTLSGAHLPRAAHDVLVAGELLHPDRPPGMKTVGRDADPRAHAELAAAR